MITETLIINNLSSIVVVNPQHIVEFTNSLAEPIVSVLGLTGQALCHQKLFNLNSPCGDCPMTTGASTKRTELTINRTNYDIMIRPIFHEKQVIGVIHQLENVAPMIELTQVLLSNKLDIQTLVKEIFDPIQRLIPCDAISILLLENNMFRIVASHDNRQNGRDIVGQTLPGTLEHLQEIMNIKKPVIITDTTNDSRWLQTAEGAWIKSTIGAPLLMTNNGGTTDKVAGIIHLDSENANSFTTKHSELLEKIARQLTLVIENTQLHEKVKQQAIRDILTGLYNRRFMEEAFTQRIEEARRNNTPIQVVMCDIDHFKNYNDTYSHAAGDQVLKQLGKLLIDSFRQGSDIVCRYGGEEFVLILPNVNSENLIKRLNIFRKNLESLNIIYREQTLPPITLSFGISSYPEFGNTGDQLLNSADKALYRAKETGRNRVYKCQTNPLTGDLIISPVVAGSS